MHPPTRVDGDSSGHDPAQQIAFLKNNRDRRTFVYFSDTEQDPTQYWCCTLWCNAVSNMTTRGFEHESSVIFGGDASDLQHGRGASRWIKWMHDGSGPDSTTEALRNAGHIVVLGNRDVNKVRLMPFVEVPPSYPPSARHGGREEADGPTMRARTIATLRARTIVPSTEWVLYNEAIGLVFDSLGAEDGDVPAPLPDLVEDGETSAHGLYADVARAALREKKAAIEPSLADAHLNALIFCKLALLTNETMGARATGAVEAGTSGLIESMILLSGSSYDAHTLDFVRDAARRLTLVRPDDVHEKARRHQHPDASRAEHAAWRDRHTVEATALRILDVAIAGVDRDRNNGDSHIVDAMRTVADAVHNWVSPGGAMHAMLTDIGELAHVHSGHDEQGRGWRVASVHAGTLTDAPSVDGDRLFDSECLYKIPTGYASGRVVWTALGDLLGDDLDGTLDEWAERLSAVYRALATHMYTCSVSGVHEGLTVDIAADSADGDTVDVVSTGPSAQRSPTMVHYDWSSVVGILGRLGGVGDGKSTGPAYTSGFAVPGHAASTSKRSIPRQNADYHDTPTLWLIGHHENPTGDRLVSNNPAIGGNKQALRADTQFFRPSFAVCIATDCEQWYNLLESAVGREWRNGPTRGLAYSSDESATGIATWLATQTTHDMSDWATLDALVVGPEVSHYGGEHADGSGPILTRARLITWRYNRYHPEWAACLFVNPKLIRDLAIETPAKSFPLQSVCTGVVVVPFHDEPGGLGRVVPLRTNEDTYDLSQNLERYVKTLAKREEDEDGRKGSLQLPLWSGDAFNASTVMWTHLLSYNQGRGTAACMAYCTPSDDRHFGARLRVARSKDTGHWELACVPDA